MSEQEILNCYQIEDGEVHIYVARSEDDALRQHMSIYDIDEDDTDETTIKQIDDNQEITIRMGEPDDSEAPLVTKTAREWADSDGRGNISTTAW